MVRINKSPAETALSRAVIRWGLSRPILVAESATSIVYRVGLREGGAAALKLFKPDITEEIRGTIVLAWYGGEGAADVFDATSDAVLMEWLPGPALSSLIAEGEDAEAAEIVAGVIASLHAPREGEIHGMISLEDRFQALIRGNPRLWPGAAHDLFARASGIALALLDSPSRVIPLHGDLHYGNILHAPRGWLAIDPKGLVGDPAYEVAPVFLNPMDNRALCTDPRRIEKLTSIFATKLGLDSGRVLRFAAVHAALSACWSLAAGEEPRHAVAVLERLLTLLPERS